MMPVLECVCEWKRARPRPGAPWTEDTCRACWLRLNDPAYRQTVGEPEWWDDDQEQLPAAVSPATCHRRILEVIDAYPRSWPPGWNDWENVRKAHQIAAKAHLVAAAASKPTWSGGRGIVIAAGGKYWPSAYVTVHMIRRVGCTLPIQCWYLGRLGERDEWYEASLAGLGVTFHDADDVRRRVPWRILNGFELKLFAVMNCPWREVLFLDADCYPVVDPTPLFEDPGYQQTGAIYWPDLPFTNDWTRWSFWGVAPFGPPCGIETGQYVVNKDAAWLALSLASWYDQHSDWCYSAGGAHGPGGDYGDKGPHRIGWAQLRRPFQMFSHVPRWQDLSFVHVGPDQEPMFVHRCRNKFALGGTGFYTPQNMGGPVRGASLPAEAMAWDIFNSLVTSLRGK